MAAESTEYNIVQAAIAAIYTNADGAGKYWNNIAAGQVSSKVELTSDRKARGFRQWIYVYPGLSRPLEVEITQRDWQRLFNLEILVISAKSSDPVKMQSRLKSDVVIAILEDATLGGTCEVQLGVTEADQLDVGNDADKPEVGTILNFDCLYEMVAGTDY